MSTVWIVWREVDANTAVSGDIYAASRGPICALRDEEEADEYVKALEYELGQLSIALQGVRYTSPELNVIFNASLFKKKFDPGCHVGLIRAYHAGYAQAIFYSVTGLPLIQYFPDNWR